MPIEFRRARPTDLAPIRAIDAHGRPGPRPISLFAAALPHLRVCVEDGQVVGFAELRRVADEAELVDIAIDPDQRRRGLGAQLLAHLLAQPGLTTIHLEVRADNRPARALYRRAGFEPVGRRPRYYRDGADALLFRHDEVVD